MHQAILLGKNRPNKVSMAVTAIYLYLIPKMEYVIKLKYRLLQHNRYNYENS